jgi:hypothetical protein
MGSEQNKDTEVRLSFSHPCAGRVKIVNPDEGIVESYCPDGTKRTKLAIVGYAESSKDLAPFDDPSWEIVGLNQLYRHIPRADRWFEIHHNFLDAVVEGTDHMKWLKEAQIPIYMVDRIPEIPNSVRFPIERVMQGHPDYFTSTVAFGLALAIEEGFKEIALYGIDLIVGDEYIHQRPCAEFWIGVAHAKGITITLPPTSALCKQSHRYGYQTEPESLIKMSELAQRRQKLMDARHKLMIELANTDGALQDCQMWGELADLRMKGGHITP